MPIAIPITTAKIPAVTPFLFLNIVINTAKVIFKIVYVIRKTADAFTGNIELFC